MLKRNITKISASVICFGAVCLIFSACLSISSNNGGGGGNSGGANKNAGGAQSNAVYETPRIVGTIATGEITESSGLTNSPCQPQILWTHNDSGDGAFLFALDKTGRKLAAFKVAGAKNTDWEDLAIRRENSGECFLYAGDIGDNSRTRGELTVYKVKEPRVSGETDSGKKNPLSTAPAQPIKFEYPNGERSDAETLLVHPATGDIYILSKTVGGAAGVYKLAAAAATAAENGDSNKINTVEKIADFAVPAIPNGLLTGGSISPDGRRVVVCDYFAAYEIELPKNAKNFDEIWQQRPRRIELGQRTQGEAVAYAADGKSIYATSEKKDSPLIEVRRK